MTVVELPSALNDVHKAVDAATILRCHASGTGLLGCHKLIDAARTAAGGLLRSGDFPFRMLVMAVHDVVLHNVVISYDIELLYQLAASGIGYGGMARRVEQMGIGPHRGCHAPAHIVVFESPLLVAVAP